MISFMICLLVIRVIGLLTNSRKETRNIEPMDLKLNEVGGELPRDILDRIDQIFEMPV